MASEMRKAIAVHEKANGGGYVKGELEKIQVFTKELESHRGYYGSTSEEQLGMKFADLTLKGIVFNETSGISDKMKKAVTSSIAGFVKSALQDVEQGLEDMRQLLVDSIEESVTTRGPFRISRTEGDKRIAEILKDQTALDRSAVYGVINKVKKVYNKTGDVEKALMDGARFANDTFVNKTNDTEFDGIGRYDDYSSYFGNFFANKQRNHYTNELIFEKSGREMIIDSWNGFMEKITSDSDAFIKTKHLSMLV